MLNLVEMIRPGLGKVLNSESMTHVHTINYYSPILMEIARPRYSKKLWHQKIDLDNIQTFPLLTYNKVVYRIVL